MFKVYYFRRQGSEVPKNIHIISCIIKVGQTSNVGLTNFYSFDQTIINNGTTVITGLGWAGLVPQYLGSITQGSRHWAGCGGALLQLLLSL